MSLRNVWVQTPADGLIRADQIAGIEAHPTPGGRGKPSHWLLDAVVSTPVGSGTITDWNVTALHRTLIQTGADPRSAPVALARLLAQLDMINAAGVVAVDHEDTADPDSDPPDAAFSTRAGGVRFRFAPFRTPPPADDRTDTE